MSLFQLGSFQLNSGATSPWKIDADALTDADIDTLAQMIRQVVPRFSSVEGIPNGGLRLAKALESFAAILGPHLIVDDVLTSGGSMRKALYAYRDQKPTMKPEPVGVVIFARGQCPTWVRAVFQCPEELWIKGKVRGVSTTAS